MAERFEMSQREIDDLFVHLVGQVGVDPSWLLGASAMLATDDEESGSWPEHEADLVPVRVERKRTER